MVNSQMFSRVLRMFRCSQMCYRRSQMFSRCSQVSTDVLKTFSRWPRDVFKMLTRCSHLLSIFVLTPSHPPIWKFLQIDNLENAYSSLLCHDWKTQYRFLSVGIVRSNLHMYLNPRMSHDMQMRETTSLLCSLSRSSISSDPCILYICGISTGRLSFYSWLYLCGSTFDRSCGKWQKRKYCVMCLDTLVEPKLNSQWHFCQSKNWVIYISYGWIIYFEHPWYF